MQVLLIQNRRILPGSNRKDVISVMGTNLSLAVIITVVALTVGIKAYLLIQIPIILIGLSFGIWLFYVQHQFEGVYWERGDDWDFVSASLEGSSYYKLPKVFQWFSGNIGFHHIHHLNSRVPNYNLERCHRELTQVRPVPEVGFIKSLKALNFRLWDEDGRRLIGFRELRQLRPQLAAD
jgi:omega-6 fatty acid desaturase (delta-12 desaturase)